MSKKTQKHGLSRTLERLSTRVTQWVGGTMSFAVAAGTVIVWGLSGPIFGFTDTWQLVINTGTTIVTFLMVFLIQRSQNKDAKAIQMKLNELVASVDGASNRLIDVEDLDEEELETLHRFYARLAQRAKQDPLGTVHSVDEAEARHEEKHRQRRNTRR